MMMIFPENKYLSHFAPKHVRIYLFIFCSAQKFLSAYYTEKCKDFCFKTANNNLRGRVFDVLKTRRVSIAKKPR